MTCFLIYEPSFRRIETRLPASAAQASFLLFSPSGELSLNGAPVDPQTVEVDAGWINFELIMAGVSEPFTEVLLKSPRLAWVHTSATGLDDPVFAQLVGAGARLTNNHSQASAIADYTLWGVLDAFQGGAGRRAAQGERRWARLPYREILGSRWLILGFGAIGQEIAQRAKSFGAKITGVRRSRGDHPLADAMGRLEDLPALLPEADVVVLCIPESAQTRGLANADFFARMKPESMIVNVGRGSLLDEAALIAALDRGAPSHALLDVFQTEPLPTESPLWGHPKITLTGHGSAMGSGVAGRTDALLLDNIDRYLTGQPLRNEVSRAEVLAG